MRLGAYPCVIKPGTNSEKAYGTSQISERHRHPLRNQQQIRTDTRVQRMKIVGTSPTQKPCRDDRDRQPSVVRRVASSIPSSNRLRSRRIRSSRISSLRR
jgi:hypothetical protein